MEFSFNKKELKRFLNIFLFENRKEDKRADFFSISDNYLWRRDQNRLVAYNMENGVDGSYNYPIEAIKELKRVEKLAIKDQGRLELEERKELKVIEPNLEVPLEANSLKLLKLKKWDSVFQIPSDFLTKQLSLMQNHLMKENRNVENEVIEIDLETFTFSLKGEMEKQMPLVLLEKPAKPISLTYSFLDFKDLLINAIQFNKMIEFNVKSPYFTKVELSENIFAILNHKKGNTSH